MTILLLNIYLWLIACSLLALILQNKLRDSSAYRFHVHRPCIISDERDAPHLFQAIFSLVNNFLIVHLLLVVVLW